MDVFNGPMATESQFSDVRGKLDDVKDVMVKNIEMVLERGEKLELLVDKTDRLNATAFTFERSSRRLKEQMFWKKVKLIFDLLILGGLRHFHTRGSRAAFLRQVPEGVSGDGVFVGYRRNYGGKSAAPLTHLPGIPPAADTSRQPPDRRGRGRRGPGQQSRSSRSRAIVAASSSSASTSASSLRPATTPRRPASMASWSPESTAAPRGVVANGIPANHMVAAASSSGLGATQGRSAAYAAHVSARRGRGGVARRGPGVRIRLGHAPAVPKPGLRQDLAHDAALPRTRQPYAGIVDLCGINQ